MSYTVSTLLLRNLHDVFGEIDPVRRRTAIDEIFHEDAVFHEPNGIYRGRDEIDRIAGVIKATHPDFRYQPLSPPEVMGDVGRVPPPFISSLTTFRDPDAATANVRFGSLGDIRADLRSLQRVGQTQKISLTSRSP